MKIQESREIYGSLNKMILKTQYQRREEREKSPYMKLMMVMIGNDF